MINKALRGCIVLSLIFLMFISSYGLPGAGAESSPPANDLNLADLGKAIEESIVAERSSVANFSDQLKILNHERIYFAAALNGYQLRVSTYESLLLASGVAVSSVQKAQSELQASINEVQKIIDEIEPRFKIITLAKSNIIQQKNLSRKQAEELRKIRDKGSDVNKLKTRTQELAGILSKKETILEQLEKIITFRLDQLNRLMQSFSDLSSKFGNTIERVKRQHLFERRKGLFDTVSIAAIEAELAEMTKEAGEYLRTERWQASLKRLWKNSGNIIVAFGFVLVVAFVFFKRASQGINRIGAHSFFQKLGPGHQLVFKLLSELFVLTGLTLVIYLCTYLEGLYLPTTGLALPAYLLMVYIAARFLKLILVMWPWEAALPSDAVGSLAGFVTFLQFFCWLYLMLNWGLGSDSISLLTVRILFEIYFIIWILRFWRRRARVAGSEAESSPRLVTLKVSVKVFSYTICGTALILDLIGYGTLSELWLISWGRTTIVVVSWIVFYRMLQEWDQYYRTKSVVERDELLHDEYPLQWLMIRFGQLVCIISLAVVIILAWGGQQAVLLKIYALLGYPLKIGSMTFSFLGMIYSILVLLATHAVVRLWRWIFQNKFLNRSGMAIGLQDSITTITVYAVWLLGITIAFHVFGLNTATLAVALGALGIGLGFGLQNIFNNFISGIILLFERPIQVGDDVEINGTWATVKKINVRSTVVQSYDNASLIIPNSEFISSQVTNWSFKDKRLRRNIDVGVAYGSDVNLVRETLLEIARTVKRVLKRPEPEVLFTDFGDSALIFRLRIWTDIDHMLKVETAIRFEIDRLFKARDIEIAFPQRDIHIRSNTTGQPDFDVHPDDKPDVSEGPSRNVKK